MPSSPHFLCIGTQKAGTTWLDEMLRGHPDLWLPPIKELQYFNEIHIPAHAEWTRAHRVAQATAIAERENGDSASRALQAHLCRRWIDDEWYREIFAQAPSDRLCGEVTPEYALLPENGIDHLLSFRDDTKLILMIRDPVDRAWSHARMLALRGDRTPVDEVLAFPDLLDRGRYKSMLARWRSRVREDRLLVLFTDHVRERPAAVLESVCRFLGVTFAAASFPRMRDEVHKGLAAPLAEETRRALAETYDEDLRFLATAYADPAAKWLSRHRRRSPREAS